MNKEKVYYKFIFPTHENIKTSSVNALISAEHYENGYVKTYEELSSQVKSYIDYYLTIPKYFDLRVYRDDPYGDNDISGWQREGGGFSLIVSHSPEVNNANVMQSWTKFSVGGKTIYCSIIVSSGNFYYNFNLPEEVLVKSNLRDSIVSGRFHENWYLTAEESAAYNAAGYGIFPVDREKMVFNTQYFKNGFHYSVRNSDYVQPPMLYTDLREDLKKDFLDLEVTRRILYNYSGITPTRDIPKVVDPEYTGPNTHLSYDPPQEYIDRPPMPIKYWLLRDALNDRDPYGDCETVLVMWVADRDPKNITDGNVTALRSLNWEQYAIPISVRCCKENGEYNTKRFVISYPNIPESGTYKGTEYSYKHRFHTRRNEEYDSRILKEALYLPDLIEYSNNYILTYQNIRYTNNTFSSMFDIQKYLFNKLPSSALQSLYVRKNYRSSTAGMNMQCYYIRVDNPYETVYKINTSLNVSIAEANNTGVIFKPNEHILQEDYQDKWTLLNEDWIDNSATVKSAINNNWFITLFSSDDSRIDQKHGVITLVNSRSLKELLESLTSRDWTHLYLSSLGISYECNWPTTDNSFYHIGSAEDPCYPLGLLDGHIRIGSTTYGRNTGNGVVIGFKNVYDYRHEDLHHFKYNSSTEEYELQASGNSSLDYTVYIMDYS